MDERAKVMESAASKNLTLADQLKLALQVSLGFQQKLNHMKQDMNELVDYKKKVEAVNKKYEDIHKEGSSLCSWLNSLASVYLPQATAQSISHTHVNDEPDIPATQESKSSSMSQFRSQSRSMSLSSNSVYSDEEIKHNDTGYYSTNVSGEPNRSNKRKIINRIDSYDDIDEVRDHKISHQSTKQENRDKLADSSLANQSTRFQKHDSDVEVIRSRLAGMPVSNQLNQQLQFIDDNEEIYTQDESQSSQVSVYEDACDHENAKNEYTKRSTRKTGGRLESSLIQINEDGVEIEDPPVSQLKASKNKPSKANRASNSMQSDMILLNSSSDESDQEKQSSRVSSKTKSHSWYPKLETSSPKVGKESANSHEQASSDDEFILNNLDSSLPSPGLAESHIDSTDLLDDRYDKWPRKRNVGAKKEKKEPDNEWVIELNKGKSFKQLTRDTIKARKSEDTRKKRIENKRRFEAKALGLSYEALIKANSDDMRPRQPGEVYLDVDHVSGKLTLPVDPSISRHLLHHQVQGVKFMFDACFESLSMIEKGDPGSGCILAHCMGLGKTIQVVALIHTLLRNSALTRVKRILILLPTNVLLNWRVEIKKWTERCPYQIRTYKLPMQSCDNLARARLAVMKSWFNDGGVLLLGYHMFTNLVKCHIPSNKPHKSEFHKYLLNPGADLLICDEGHVLKNMDTNLNKAAVLINTPRRIVLTGTPLQNNLIEYYCMVNLVKPSLLGTIDEYRNQFVNPIENGQTKDASPADVVYMKHRAHVLHFILNQCVQRKDMDLIKKLLPEKKEYVLSVRLSELQIRLYSIYLGEFLGDLNSMEKFNRNLGGMLFKDFQELFRIWNHPCLLKVYKEKYAKQRKPDIEDLDDSYIDDSESDKLKPRGSKVKNEPIDNKELWWEPYINHDTKFDPEAGGKLIILGKIIALCKKMNDKLLVFSQSLLSLDLVEEYLKYRQVHRRETWKHGQDYFRIDGSVNVKSRNAYINKFNKSGNPQARLFLISTKAGGVGVNLVAANRCVIFDVCWNPAHDIQSMFRVYRFGQTKNVYIYRLIAQGTMEEKIYRRQIAKQGLSKRVIDEHQLDRHFTQQELRELYKFEPAPPGFSLHEMPDDNLLKEVLVQCPQWMVKYHEHCSLLENRTDEYLTEEEKKAAWEEYEKERQKTYCYFDQEGVLTSLKPSDDEHVLINKAFTVPGSSKASWL